MARQVKFDEPAEDIPVWFLTYSDVITLLMTFFILLLTFATTEPESFERMQISLFGGGGGTGAAGKLDTMPKDAIISRIRPRSGRITKRGAENQPIDTNTTVESLAKGLESMQQDPEHDLLEGQSLKTNLTLFVDDEGLTPLGSQRLNMMARQLKSGPFQVSFRVYSEADIAQAYAMLRRLHDQGVTPQQTAMQLQNFPAQHDKSVEVLLTRTLKE